LANELAELGGGASAAGVQWARRVRRETRYANLQIGGGERDE